MNMMTDNEYMPLDALPPFQNDPVWRHGGGGGVGGGGLGDWGVV